MGEVGNRESSLLLCFLALKNPKLTIGTSWATELGDSFYLLL